MFNFFKKTSNKWKKRDYRDIAPDEIFLDSKNLPEFNTYQFEGRLEKSISPKVFSIFGFACLIIVVVFLIKLGSLQIVHGSFYKNRSENNKLKQILLIAPRGIIYSRDGAQLVWNEKSENQNDTYSLRKYIETPGFSNLLGFLKYPAKDSSGFYYEEEFSPKDGAELYLNEILAGKNGLELIETSVNGEVVSENTLQPPKNGENMTISIDSKIQAEFYKITDGGQLPLKDKIADFVFSSEVLEHIYDVENAFSEIARILKLGGRLLLTTPYHGLLKNILIALFSFNKHFNPAGPHIRFFTKKSLFSLLKKNGFEIRAYGYYGRFYPISHSIFVLAEKKKDS